MGSNQRYTASKEQLPVSVLCLFYLLNFGSSNILFFFFLIVILQCKSYFISFGLVFIFYFIFTFSYALLIVLNRSGLFTILLTHDDENRVMFFNRACCFKYLNKINPSFAMSYTQHFYQLNY